MAPDVGWFQAEKEITYGGWRTVDQHARPSYSFQIEGANHLSFMDVPFLPLRSDSAVKPMVEAAEIEPHRMRSIVTGIVLAFLARHLLGSPDGLLDEATAHYPEAT